MPRLASLNKQIGLYESVPTRPVILSRLRQCLLGFAERAASSRQQVEGNLETVTCVLNYHPVLSRALRTAGKKPLVPKSLGLNMRVAWRNGLWSLNSVLACHNERVIHTYRVVGRAACVFCNYATCTHCAELPSLPQLLQQRSM